MALFPWEARFSVNVENIDSQHRQLIDIINELHEAMMKKRSKEVLGELLERLVDYTDVHFTYEEELMARYEFPGYHDHKRQHDTIRNNVQERLQEHRDGKIVMSIKVMEYLKKWLSEHIMGTDRLYADFLNSEGVY